MFVCARERIIDYDLNNKFENLTITFCSHCVILTIKYKISVQYVPAVRYLCVKSFLLVCFQFPFHFRNYDRAGLKGMEGKMEEKMERK